MTEPQRLGKYRLVRRIAVGGVAEVYLAVAEGTAGFEKRVVVKRLMPARSREASVVAMFLDEARLMALFHHPHVVEVYDIGTEAGEHFFAMEHVEGCDLRDLLDARGPDAPLPLPAALAIVRAVALGLGHAHDQTDRAGAPLGVVHRDVSPSNVLLGRGGEVKLVDFGVAKWAAQRSRTEHGTLKGKFAYMSPEQCRGEPLDRRSDLFALGVLLYELTTGARPFAGQSDFDLLSAIVRGEYPPPSQLRADYPPVLAAVISRALAPVASDRFAEARELVAGLDGAAQALGVAADFALVADLVAAHAPTRTLTPALPAAVSAPSGPARPNLDRTATDWSTPPPAPMTAGRPSRAGWRLLGVAALGLALAGGGWALYARTPRANPVAPGQEGQLSSAINNGSAVAPPSSPKLAPAVAPGADQATPELPRGGAASRGADKSANEPAAPARGAGAGGPNPRRSPKPRGLIDPPTGAGQGGDPAPRTTSNKPSDNPTTDNPANVPAPPSATRSPPPDALPAPAAPPVKIWDVDSPLPPP